MGSGFKSRGVHHWENGLRFVETQTGGCFVLCPDHRLLRTCLYQGSKRQVRSNRWWPGTKKRGPGFSKPGPRFPDAACSVNGYLATLSIRAPALLGVVENWLASSRTTALSSWRRSSGSIDADARTDRSISTAWATASLPCSVSDTTWLLRSEVLRTRAMWPWDSRRLRVLPMVWACTRTYWASWAWVMGPCAARTSMAITPACVSPMAPSFSFQECSTSRAAVDRRRPVGQ